MIIDQASFSSALFQAPWLEERVGEQTVRGTKKKNKEEKKGSNVKVGDEYLQQQSPSQLMN